MADKKSTLKTIIGKVEMTDAGHKLGESTLKVATKPSDKKYYPSITLSCKDVPSLKGLSVGDTVTLVAHAVVKSHSAHKSESYENDDYTLELRHVGVANPKK